jgi:hypothetical protein
MEKNEGQKSRGTIPLRMLLLTFCLDLPHRSRLGTSPWQGRQIQSTLKQWLPSKIVGQKRSVCSAEHLSNLPFAKQALIAWLGIFQQAFFVPLSRKSSVEIFSYIYTTFFIPGGLPPVALSLLDSSGAVCPATSRHGRDLASAVSRARFTAMSDFNLCRSPSHNVISLTFTSIWWDHCNLVITIRTF